jgi:hypothetical protein
MHAWLLSASVWWFIVGDRRLIFQCFQLDDFMIEMDIQQIVYGHWNSELACD